MHTCQCCAIGGNLVRIIQQPRQMLRPQDGRAGLVRSTGQGVTFPSDAGVNMDGRGTAFSPSSDGIGHPVRRGQVSNTARRRDLRGQRASRGMVGPERLGAQAMVGQGRSKGDHMRAYSRRLHAISDN